MPRFPILAPLVGMALCLPLPARALSLMLPQPDVQFPPHYDAHRAQAIEDALHAKDLRFVSGLYSHWPPDWSTTLVYDGDAPSLNRLLHALGRVPGLKLRVTFSPDLSRETGSALPAGSWFVIYSQATPQVLTIRLNLASPAFDLKHLEFDPIRAEFHSAAP